MRRVLIIIVLHLVIINVSGQVPQKGFNMMAHPAGSSYTHLYNQFHYVAVLFDSILQRGYNTSDIWLRPRGGSGSQKHDISMWTDSLCFLWGQLQSIYNFKAVFVINYNRPVAEEIDLFNKFQSFGLTHHAIEYGNEFYLNKFFLGDTLHASGTVTPVTAFMTVEKYQLMTDDFIAAFETFALPHLLIFAPAFKGTPAIQARYIDWNSKMSQFICSHIHSNLHGTLHVYSPSHDFSADTIGNIKNLLPQGRSLHVTEYGFKNDDGSGNEHLTPEQLAIEEAIHAQRILEQLSDEDVMYSHQLFNNYLLPGALNAWINYNGITPKGFALLNLLFPYIYNSVQNRCHRERILIKPNPTSGYFSIELIQPEKTQVSLYNSNGKKINIVPVTTENMLSIDASHLSNGLYFLQINTKHENYVERVVLMR